MPLIPYIQEVLLAEKSQQEKMRRTMRKAYSKKYLDYVCVDALGEILTPQYVTRHFKFILRHNGLKNIRFHDLRHSYAVAALRSGDDIKTVQGNLGHATAAFTLDVYSHVTEQMKQDSASRMEQFIKTVSGS